MTGGTDKLACAMQSRHSVEKLADIRLRLRVDRRRNPEVISLESETRGHLGINSRHTAFEDTAALLWSIIPALPASGLPARFDWQHINDTAVSRQLDDVWTHLPFDCSFSVI
jgi:hypothetical protein